MTDFLTRLAERSLMLADVVRPATAPMFAPASGRETGEPSELRGEEEHDTTGGLLEILETSARGLSRPPDRAEATPLDLPAHLRDDARGVAPALFGPAEDPVTGRATGRDGGGSPPNEQGMKNASPGDSSDPEGSSRQRLNGPPRLAPHASRERPIERTPSRLRGEPDSTSTRRAALPGTIRPREIHLAQDSADISRGSRDARRETPQPAPIIKVSIGRVEVRALGRQTPPAPRAGPRQTGPALTLDQYLKQRDEGKR